MSKASRVMPVTALGNPNRLPEKVLVETGTKAGWYRELDLAPLGRGHLSVVRGMTLKPTYYITTPIYYPTADLHIGHAYTTVAADALARFKRMQGYDVLFLTGTDEHGQKLESRAREEGVSPQAFVDGIVIRIKELWRLMGITHDDFVRTTEKRHMDVVQHIFAQVFEKGDIYKGQYEGWYCEGCEGYFTATQAREMDGHCQDHERPLQRLQEDAYFFRMSSYSDRLLEHIRENPQFIQPESRRNEIVAFIERGLEDLCVSRSSFHWGIPVPFDEEHVIYVWFDALSNYLTGAGYPDDLARFERYWPADVHLVGKEITRFHAIIWPIILMAAGLPLPRQIFAHGWLVLDSGKMSKTRGNVVDPVILIEKYGVDAVRYFLLCEVPFGMDGVYSEDALIARLNSDLANDQGNLVHRTVSMLHKFLDGEVLPPGAETELDRSFRERILATPERMGSLFDAMEISKAVNVMRELASFANKYIDEAAPWALAKEGQKDRLATVFYYLAECLRVLAIVSSPLLVETPEKLWSLLGLEGNPRSEGWSKAQEWGVTPPHTRVGVSEPLFPRIVDEEKKEEKKQPKVPQLTMKDFQQVEMKVGTVKTAEAIPKAERLLKLTVDIGDEVRQIVAGIAESYRPEDLTGQQVVVLTNLRPAKIRGVKSEGMVLAAVDDGIMRLLVPDGRVEEGSKIS